MADLSEYIACPKCGKPVKANAAVCGHCWTKLASEAVVGVSNVIDHSSRSSASGELATMTVRYRDAYTVASAINQFGNVIKILGAVLAGVIFLAALGAADETFGWRAVVGGAILGAWVGGTIFLLGIMVSAQGQILQATLDTAVNTSPLLSNEHRMGLMRG